MNHQPSDQIKAAHALSVFPADAFCVTEGVNHSEYIRDPQLLCLGDAYTLRRSEPLQILPLEELDSTGLRPTFKVSEANTLEALGTRIAITARLTFITHIGASVDVLVLSADAANGRSYLHPLGPLEAQTEYMLIKVCDSVINLPTADLTGVSFGRGTRITTATGAQVPVEQLSEGDRILTRDNGMQAIRWIGTRTVQGVGSFAPVVIAENALGNADALVISQTHRMMLSDWRAEVMMGSKDVLIEAQDLVNDKDIYLRPGGFVEYTQLVFDEHQIIYAEGVATESLHLTPQILSGLDPELASELLARFPKLPSEEKTSCRPPLTHVDARNFLRQTGRL